MGFAEQGRCFLYPLQLQFLVLINACVFLSVHAAARVERPPPRLSSSSMQEDPGDKQRVRTTLPSTHKKLQNPESAPSSSTTLNEHINGRVMYKVGCKRLLHQTIAVSGLWWVEMQNPVRDGGDSKAFMTWWCSKQEIITRILLFCVPRHKWAQQLRGYFVTNLSSPSGCLWQPISRTHANRELNMIEAVSTDAIHENEIWRNDALWECVNTCIFQQGYLRVHSLFKLTLNPKLFSSRAVLS